MNSSLAGEKARWTVAAAGALAVLLLLVWLFRIPPPAPLAVALPGKETPPNRVIQLAKSATGDEVLAEELVLRDMRPLFLPMPEFNVAIREPRREAGKTFLDNETLRLSFSESELNVAAGLPPAVTINGKPAAAATPLDSLGRDSAGPALQGFGRAQRSVEQLAARGGFVEVVAVDTGRRVWAEALPPEARAPGEKAWEPMEFFASVTAAGLASPLVVATSSRVEEVDAHYRNFLARSYRIGDRLAPGFYRIVVGP